MQVHQEYTSAILLERLLDTGGGPPKLQHLGCMGGIPTQLGRMLWGKERGKENESGIKPAPLREKFPHLGRAGPLTVKVSTGAEGVPQRTRGSEGSTAAGV